MREPEPVTTVHVLGNRELFDLYSARLAAYAQLYPGARLDPSRWRWFSSGSPQDIALHLAFEGDTASLTTLVSCFPGDLKGDVLLRVLSCLPETLRPRRYESLLPVRKVSRLQKSLPPPTFLSPLSSCVSLLHFLFHCRFPSCSSSCMLSRQTHNALSSVSG